MRPIAREPRPRDPSRRRAAGRVSRAGGPAPGAPGRGGPGEPVAPRAVRGRLFRKYVALFVGVVCGALLANGGFEVWFSSQEHKASLIHIEREQADAAAAKIGQFITEIVNQVGWTTQLPWSVGT